MLFITLTLLVIYLLLTYVKNSKKRRDIERIPGPPALPILGNVLDMGSNSVTTFRNLVRLAKQYGPIFRLWLGPTTPFVVISGAQYMEEVLVAKSIIDKGNFYRVLENWIGHALPIAPAEKWQETRKIVAPAFNTVSLKKHVRNLNKNANKLLENIKSINFDKDCTKLYTFVSTCSLENVCEAIICQDIDYKYKEEYMEGIRTVSHLTVYRLFSVFARFDTIYKFTAKYKEEMEAIAKMNKLVDSLIAKKIEERLDKRKEQQMMTILDILLDLAESDPMYTYTMIRNEINAVMAAGSETVSTALKFGIYQLSKNTYVQNKALLEIEAVLGDDHDIDITIKDLDKMPYLDCVYKEILRQFCPIPMIERKLREDINIDGMDVPKGTTLVLFIYGLHHNENVYPDPEKFEPERFLPENSVDRSSYAFLPYSAGKRNCVGLKFSALEVKIALCKIIRNFEIIAIEPEHNPILYMEMLLKSGNGLPLMMKPRQKIQI